jgi:hypothetical protein
MMDGIELPLLHLHIIIMTRLDSVVDDDPY